LSYFHYTSIESFFYIFSSSNVHFNSLALMNDELEGHDLHRVLSDILKEKYTPDECRSHLELVDTMIQTYLRKQMSFSACTLEDDISQWRAYSPLGLGLCIEFDDGFITGSDVKKIHCIYDYEDKKEKVAGSSYLRANDKSLNALISDSVGLTSYINHLSTTLVSFKNSSFKPEQEVRWVCSKDDCTDSEVKFRPHRLGLTTFTEKSVDLSKVKSVTLGPQVPKENYYILEDFLINFELPLSIKILSSNVSLR